MTQFSKKKVISQATGGAGVNSATQTALNLKENVISGITAAGTNTYTSTYSPTPTAYTTGFKTLVTFTNANTGAATINLNGLGAISIVKGVSTALAANDISANSAMWLEYNGTNFVIVGSNTFSLSNNSSIILKKTGDQTNSGTTTTATVITDLTFPVLANSTYLVRGQVRNGCSGTGGTSFGLNIPSGTIGGSYLGRTNSASTALWQPFFATVSGALGANVNTINSNLGITKFDWLLYIGATPGNADIIFASGTNPQTSTIFAESSYFEILKIA